LYYDYSTATGFNFLYTIQFIEVQKQFLSVPKVSYQHSNKKISKVSLHFKVISVNIETSDAARTDLPK
jgi:hypothetical protein